MGFYTYFGDKLGDYKPIVSKLVGEFDSKYVGGYELYHWCFENNIKQIKYYDDLIFELTQEEVKKAIIEKAMSVNSNSVLKRLLRQMVNKNIEVIYFYGSY